MYFSESYIYSTGLLGDTQKEHKKSAKDFRIIFTSGAGIRL